MEEFLNLIIVTPQEEFYNGKVKELQTEDINGHIGILPNHTPIIALLKPTVTVINAKDGKTLKAHTSDGIMEVENNMVKILCNSAEWNNK